MYAIPIYPVSDTLTIKHISDSARFHLRCPVMTGLHVGPPMFAYEPKNSHGLRPTEIYELPKVLERLVIVGLEPSWSDHVLKQACEVGAVMARDRAVNETVGGEGRDLASPPTEPAFPLPQPRVSLDKLFREMSASGTSVLAYAHATKKRRSDKIAVVLLDGAGAVAEMRRRMNLSEHATLSYLTSERGRLF